MLVWICLFNIAWLVKAFRRKINITILHFIIITIFYFLIYISPSTPTFAMLALAWDKWHLILSLIIFLVKIVLKTNLQFWYSKTHQYYFFSLKKNNAFKNNNNNKQILKVFFLKSCLLENMQKEKKYFTPLSMNYFKKWI